MLDFKRAFVAALCTVALAAGALAPAIAQTAPSSPIVPAGSDIPLDPALRTGRLPNGMRYVIMRNATPPGQTAIRLRIDAGSLMETDEQRGLAHFLEHMAFNGSTNVPEGEMVKILERAGLAFGPDTNASTSFDQTVYELDLPKSDETTLDTALMLLREATGALLLEDAAIDRERGVVQSEERTRASPAYRILEERYRFLLQGQLPATRFPIGDGEVLKTAKRDRFLAFYNAYYRPERATIVVVGDVDPAKIEAKIKARFGDWKSSGPNGREPNLGQIAQRGAQAKVVVEPGGPATVLVGWVNPPDLSVDTRQRRKQRLVRQLGFQVLNRRYEQIARGANPPFIGAGAFRYTDVDAADLTLLSISNQPGKWREAMEAAEREQRRIVQWGVQQAEVDREVAEFRALLQAAVAGTATRRSTQLAESIVDSINSDEVFTSDAFDLELFEEAVRGLKAETVTAELRTQFSGQGPLVFVTSPTPIEGADATVAAAFAQSRQAAVEAPAQVVAKAWPYESFGTPGRVAETQEILDLDTTFVRFENGVRLTVKPTKYRDDQVLVAVRVGDGYLDLPLNRQSFGWAAGLQYIEGGLGKLTAQEVEQTLASVMYGASFTIDEDAFVLSGRTRPQDFQRQMQVLAAYLTDPAWRPEPFERVRTYGTALLDQLESTPGGVFSREGAAMLRSGDWRWRFPTREDFAGARLQDLRAVVSRPLNEDPIEVIIVGDISVEEAVKQTAATFGALPVRRAAAPPAADARAVRFPAASAQPVRLTHKGRPDQAMALIAWPGLDFASDPQEARKLRVLELIMQLRLNDELRERQGVTYSPRTDFESPWSFPGYGYVSASVQAPPDKLEGFFATVSAIARDLREKPVTADEIARARGPRVQQLTQAQNTNEYWLGQLEGGQADRRRLDAIRAAIPGLERVTAADVQAAARRYLTDDKAWKLVIVPQG